MPKYVWKVNRKIELWNGKSCIKKIPKIVAANALALSRLVTHNNPIFSIKTTLCETSNIRFKNEC